MNSTTCSFCGKSIAKKDAFTKREFIIEGAEGNICNKCITTCLSTFEKMKNEVSKEINKQLKENGVTIPNPQIKSEINSNHSASNTLLRFLKPHEIKEALDLHVIGQDEAKKILSVAAYNHYKRITGGNEDPIDKTNVILLGPTGSGKTYIMQKLADILDVPLVIADATSLTEAGYEGGNVEDILSALLKKAGGNVSKAEKGIVYIDEIDKIATRQHSNSKNSRDPAGEGVQQALLKIVEDSNVEIKEVNGMSSTKNTINTKNILFVCGGAFVGIETHKNGDSKNSIKKTIGFNTSRSCNNEPIKKEDKIIVQQDFIDFGLIPEFVGRFPVIAQLNPLTKNDMIEILTKPKNSIINQYTRLLRSDGVILKFEDDAVEYIAEEALEKKIGARGLKGVIEKKMMDIMFDIPQRDDIKEFKITRAILKN